MPSALAIVLTLAAGASLPPDQAVTEAAAGLVAQIEDDDNPDTMLKSLRAQGCTVTIEGEDRSQVLDWSEIAGVGLGDPTFIAIARPGGITALVTDGEDAAQLAKLGALNKALGELAKSCRKKG